MLAAPTRMRRREDFTHTVRSGARAGSRALTVHLGTAETDDGPRVGFIVPRAVGGAVVRNRTRRRLRHLTRARLAALAPRDALVVRAGAPAAALSTAALASEFDRALGRLGRPTAPAVPR